MKRSILLLTLTVSIVYTGCSLFMIMPKKIDSQFLREKSESQKQKIESIEKDIIEITNSKNNIDNELKVNSLKKNISKKMLKQSERDKEILEDKQRLYIINNESSKLESLKLDIKKNENKQSEEKLKLQYYEANENYLEAFQNYRDAELSHKVSEKLYLEAQIGRGNQDKIYGKETKDSKNKKGIDRINVKEYEEYRDKQKKKLAEKKLKYEETVQFKKLVIEKLKQAGLEGKI